MKQQDYTIIKVITTILVVIAHITRFYSMGGGAIKKKYNFLLHYITSFVYSFHMPLFICVSGAIFSFCINNKKKYSDFRLFIIKKWKRLMVPYFLIGIFYVMPVMCTLKITNLNPINYIKENIILSKDARHLWFLWTLFFIFIIVRMFYHRYEKSNRLFIGVLLFFISFFSDKLPNIFQLQGISYYLFFFCIGYEFDRNKKKIDEFLGNRKWIVILGWIFISFVVLYTYNRALNLITAVIGMLCLYQCIRITKKYIIQIKIYKWIERDSFGIYLFHPMIIYVLFYWVKKFGFGLKYPIIVCVMIFVITMIASMLFVKIIRWTKYGKLIIGE